MMQNSKDNTTNKDMTGSTITDSDTTTDNDECTITNNDAINNTVTDDDTVITCNAMDKLNLFDSNYLYFIFCDLPLKRLVYFVHTDIKFF